MLGLFLVRPISTQAMFLHDPQKNVVAAHHNNLWQQETAKMCKQSGHLAAGRMFLSGNMLNNTVQQQQQQQQQQLQQQSKAMWRRDST